MRSEVMKQAHMEASHKHDRAMNTIIMDGVDQYEKVTGQSQESVNFSVESLEYDPTFKDLWFAIYYAIQILHDRVTGSDWIQVAMIHKTLAQLHADLACEYARQLPAPR